MGLANFRSMDKAKQSITSPFLGWARSAGLECASRCLFLRIVPCSDTSVVVAASLPLPLRLLTYVMEIIREKQAT